MRSQRVHGRMLGVACVCFLTFGNVVHAAPRQLLSVEIEKKVYSVGEKIELRITNGGDRPVTYCAVACGMIVTSDAPIIPEFEVQSFQNGKWGTYLWGCDIGRLEVVFSLDAKESFKSVIVMRFPGRYRIRLWYGQVASVTKCSGPHSKKHTNFQEIQVVHPNGNGEKP